MEIAKIGAIRSLAGDDSAAAVLAANPRPYLRWIRVSARLTLRELAAEIGTSAATISRWENGLAHPSRALAQRTLQCLIGRMEVDQ